MKFDLTTGASSNPRAGLILDEVGVAAQLGSAVLGRRLVCATASAMAQDHAAVLGLADERKSGWHPASGGASLDFSGADMTARARAPRPQL